MKTTHEPSIAHVTPPSAVSYTSAFLALLLLLGVTVGIAYVHLGALNTGVAMAIATVKAAIVLWYFMHLPASPKIVLAFLIAAVLMLAVSAILTLTDYVTRGSV